MKYYPQLLVTAQFLLFGIILLFSLTHFRVCWWGFGLTIAGFYLGLQAVHHHPKHNFNIVPELKEGCQLVTHGPYRYIRHPMYSAVMLLAAGLTLLSTHPLWLLWTLLGVVLWLKASREERLWMQHDPCYGTYRAQTRYFIPYIL